MIKAKLKSLLFKDIEIVRRKNKKWLRWMLNESKSMWWTMEALNRLSI